MRIFEKCNQRIVSQEGAGGRGGDGGKIKWRLSEVNSSAVSTRQNELKGKFKMAVSDVIRIMGQVMEYTYIPTGIKRELVRFCGDCNQKGYIVGIFGGGTTAIHSNG